ncbi:transglutaminase domain-containing protein [Thermoleptolyngbya sichuanensis A183]|uniref:Transglutaminase domain-containing protein n=2 Tax=Thermoleptolyngbya TaxID=2303528 RepID=A0A6M8B5W4_9CYAN|nr:transglutaminase domain-containing protein [Thermoleptolyngbya sichuanensis A183]
MLLEPALSNASEQPGDSLVIQSNATTLHRTVRPVGVYMMRGLALHEGRLLTLDAVRGYLVAIAPDSDSTTILNSKHTEQFLDGSGLAIAGDTLWFTRENRVYRCPLTDLSGDTLTPDEFATLPYPADGVAVYGSAVYVTCQKAGAILIYDAETQREITRFAAPGVGIENLTFRGEELWLCDRLERTVYCMDRATGELRFSLLTPFDSPSGLAFYPDPATGDEVLYVVYSFEEAYIRDDPNNPELPYELTFRDRTFLHPLYFRYDPQQHYTLSNGFLVEMIYAEEISPLDAVQLNSLEWRIALPAETARQRLRQVEPIGIPFTEELQDGQRVAVFKFDQLRPHESHIFGWKALLEVRGIKYQFTYDDVEKIPPLSLEFQSRYLVDDDDLAMDTPAIRAAARESIGTETNLLRKILKIRNYVYDRLSYSIKPHIDTPDVALERGTGSCGEYVGILLALARLNGIACRTVGRYKCPPYADRQRYPLEPEFNHVWIEFYIPGFGWLPMESNVDDVVDGGPYPTRFFMGLPWFHAEMAKGISFENIKTPTSDVDVSIGDLAINHVRFTILEELPPL